jgi:hypothetical protein
VAEGARRGRSVGSADEPSRQLVVAVALSLAVTGSALAAPKPPTGGSTAPAQVFAPNPVADLGIQTLTDQRTQNSSRPIRRSPAPITASR